MKQLVKTLVCFLFFAVVCLPGISIAQSAADELQKISASYASCKTFKTDFELFFTNLKTPNKVLEKSKGALYRSGSNMYLNSLGTETIVNDSYTVVISHNDKVVLVGRSGAKQMSHADILQKLLNTNKSLESSGSLQFRNIRNHVNEIVITYTSGEYASVSVIYDSETYFVKEIKLVYPTAETGTPCVRVKYSNTKVNAPISEYLFNEKRVVNIRNKKAYVVTHLKGYQLIQNL